ncbi:MAG: hypothetical protein QOJ19_4503, partial [Acidimicrobiia bacterium]|nr:hypothetical protein [Acidimicrobiia bacterium]
MGDVMAVFDDEQVAARKRRDVEFEALVAWNAAEVTGRAGTCGTPFGLASTRYLPSEPGGVYRRCFDGCEMCADANCPICGKKMAVERCALASLAVGRQIAAGRLPVFLSIAGSHEADEPVSDVYRRLKLVTDQIPGNRTVRRMIEAEFGGKIEYVRRVEPSYGGQNGVHPNAHFVWLLHVEAGDDADEVAELFMIRLRATLVRCAWDRRRKGDVKPWAAVQHFLSERAWDCRVAGVNDAEYLAKLDGVGLAKSSSELVDVSGAKRGKNVGERAMSFWIAQLARANGYGPRSMRKAIREMPRIAEVVAQAKASRQATKGKQMWRAAEGLFDEWKGLDTGQLVEAAARFCSAESAEAMWQLIQPDDPAPDPPANGPGERSATGDSTAASILDRPAPWVSEVWLDGSARLAEVAWVDAGPGRDAPGGIDGAVCSLLDEQGPWAGVLAI